jgi:hypothetical protein
MKRTRTTVCIAAAMLASLVTAPMAGADWSSLGGSINADPTANAGGPAIANVGGVPYVAYTQQTASGSQVYVDRWNGTSWAQVGGALNVGVSAFGPSITGVNGVPWVAWTDGGVVYVKQWTGSAWAQVGGALNLSTLDSAGDPSVTTVGNTPYVAFVESIGAAPSHLYIESWNGASWSQVGGTASSNLSAYSLYPSLASVGGVPTVAWVEQNGLSTKLQVADYSGGTWSGGLPLDLFSGPRDPKLIDVGGVPYVAWSEYNGTGEQIYVKRRQNDSSWTAVGPPLSIDPVDDALTPSMTVVGGEPLLAWEENYGNHNQLVFRQWSGTAWNPVGSDLVDPGSVATTAIANVGGVPYVAWGETTPTHEIMAGALLAGFSSEQSLATDTGAMLSARVADLGLQLPIEFQYGAGSSLTTTTPPQTTDGGGSATVEQSITGLKPSTTYSWRAIQSDGTTQTAVGPTQTFTTEPTNGPGTSGADGKVELVVCQYVKKKVVRRVHHRRRRVTVTVKRCTTKLVSGPVTFNAAVSR